MCLKVIDHVTFLRNDSDLGCLCNIYCIVYLILLKDIRKDKISQKLASTSFRYNNAAHLLLC